jgi:hypothetical protein
MRAASALIGATVGKAARSRSEAGRNDGSYCRDMRLLHTPFGKSKKHQGAKVASARGLICNHGGEHRFVAGKSRISPTRLFASESAGSSLMR